MIDALGLAPGPGGGLFGRLLATGRIAAISSLGRGDTPSRYRQAGTNKPCLGDHSHRVLDLGGVWSRRKTGTEAWCMVGGGCNGEPGPKPRMPPSRISHAPPDVLGLLKSNATVQQGLHEI